MGRSNKRKKQRGGKRKAGGSGGAAESRSQQAPHGRSGDGEDDDGRRDIYARYKESTQSFRDGLSKLLPATLPLVSVADLGNSVEYLLRQSKDAAEKSPEKLVPAVGLGLLSCLNESIKLREEFTSFVKGDEGHRYMNAMLRYCQDVLRQCRKIYVTSLPSTSGVGAVDKKCADDHQIVGQFEALGVQDEEDDKSDEESYDKHIVRPEDPDRTYTIEGDLIGGDDRLRASIHMHQIQQMFDMVECNYKILKDLVTAWKKQTELPESVGDISISTCTMSTSCQVSLCLEEIKYLEHSLLAECPQFKTIYHVVAILIFNTAIIQLGEHVHPTVLAKNPHLTLDFVATEVEYGFRTPADPGFQKYEQRAKTFMKRGKISTEEGRNCVNVASNMVLSLTFLEVSCDFIKSHPQFQPVLNVCLDVREKLFPFPGCDKSYFSELFGVFTGCLGGDRSIWRTQSMLQCQTHGLPDASVSRLMPNKEMQMPIWNEESNKAEGTTDTCMVSLFHQVFFNEWFHKTRSTRDWVTHAFYQGLTPRIFPLLQGFLDYLKSRNSPVPFSFTLSVHAMLLGIHYLQGDGDVQMIAMVSQKASERYYEQLNWLLNQEDALDNQRMLKKMRAFQHASMPYRDETSPGSTLAFWNPYVAGSFLAQIVYLNSLWYGPKEMDIAGQTVSVIHLFHALRERNLIRDLDVLLLRLIDQALESCSAVWGDGKPSQGSFCKHFFVAGEVSLSASVVMTDLIQKFPWKSMQNLSGEKQAELEELVKSQIVAERDINLIRLFALISMRRLKRGSRQESRFVKPEDISTSFRYVVHGDFSGLDENDFSQGNSMSALTSKGSARTVLRYYTRAMALDKRIEKEAPVLSLNYPKLAWILRDSMSKLSTHMGWDSIVDQCCTGSLFDSKVSKQNREAEIIKTLIGDRILGELDFESDETKCKESKKCASFLVSYFGSFEKEDLWFI